MVICPLFGGKCPGERNCFPAQNMANRENALKDSTQRKSEPICPIVASVDSFRLAATALLPLVNILIGNEEQQNSTIPTDEEQKRQVLEKLKITELYDGR